MTETFDAVVAGAGPAGLTFSRYLAEQGFNVAVLERALAIGEPRHDTGGSFPDMLQNHGISEDVIAQKINRIRFETVGCKAVEKAMPNSKYAIILKRRDFARALAEKAVDAGVDLRLNSRVTGTLKRGGTAGVSFREFGAKSEIKAKLVVDATGKENAILAREAGLFGYKHNGLSSYFECEFFCKHLEDPKMAVHGLADYYAPPHSSLQSNEYAPIGYGWIYPTGEKSAIVGIGRQNTSIRELSKHFSSFVKCSFSKVASDFRVVEYHVGSAPRTFDIEIKTTCADNFLCIGSAAGYANPLWNEGMRFVMNQAKTSADVCAAALEADDLSQKRLSECHKRWEKENGLLWKLIKKFARKDGGLTHEKWERLLQTVETLDEDTVYNIMRGTPSVKDVLKIALKSRL